MKTRWEVQEEHPESREADSLYGLHPVIFDVILNRGVTQESKIHSFLNPKISDSYDPFLLDDLEEGAERILLARERREKVLVVGDYDVDGITGTTLLYTALLGLGIEASYFIPHRLIHGYGVKGEDIDMVLERGASLVVTVDNGIKAYDFAARCKEEGIDLIVTDHHIPDSELPPATYVINPKREASRYPFRDLSGVGVAFKLVQGLYRKCGQGALLDSFLKWAAIGTVADIVPLVDENRIFVREGFRSLSDLADGGLKALLTEAGVNQLTITAEDVYFRIGPRINVAGRLEDPNLIMELFLGQGSEATTIAQSLNTLNSRRQSIEQKVLKEARRRIEKEGLFRDPVIVVESDDWHRGVIGIASTKLVEEYGRPVILVAVEEDGRGYASGRSAGNVSLIDKIERLKELFVLKDGSLNYGGHSQAVGFSLPCENISLLRERIRETFSPDETAIEKRYRVEAFLELNQLDDSFFDSLQRLLPFGFGNPKPLFGLLEAQLLVKSSRHGSKKIHLEVEKGGRSLPGYFWDRPGLEIQSGKRTLLFFPHRNSRGEISLEVVDSK